MISRAHMVRLDLSVPSLIITIGTLCLGGGCGTIALVKIITAFNPGERRKIPAILFAISIPPALGIVGFLASTMVPATLIYHGQLMGGVIANYVWALFVTLGLCCLLISLPRISKYAGPGSIAIRTGLIGQLIVYVAGISLFVVMHLNP